MGLPMARHLLKAGHEVALWTNNAAKAKELAAKGKGTACATPQEVAERAGGELWFQAYLRANLEATHQVVARAKAAGFPAGKIRSFATIDELEAAQVDFSRTGDVLYAKGSNGIKLGRLVDRLLGPPEVS